MALINLPKVNEDMASFVGECFCVFFQQVKSFLLKNRCVSIEVFGGYKLICKRNHLNNL